MARPVLLPDPIIDKIGSSAFQEVSDLLVGVLGGMHTRARRHGEEVLGLLRELDETLDSESGLPDFGGQR